MAGFARRDENSSIGATITRRGPVGPGQTRNLNARSGFFEGKARGVGRHQTRDQNSSPRVTRVQPRTPDGKFTSHENDLKIYHPDGNKYRSRQPRTSALGIHRKEGGHVSRVYNGKKSEQTVFKSAGNTPFGSSPTRGRRIGLAEMAQVGKAFGSKRNRKQVRENLNQVNQQATLRRVRDYGPVNTTREGLARINRTGELARRLKSAK